MMCPSHPRARNVHLDRTACETLLPVQWSPAGATIQARKTSRAEHRPVVTFTRQRVELGIQVLTPVAIGMLEARFFPQPETTPAQVSREDDGGAAPQVLWGDDAGG